MASSTPPNPTSNKTSRAVVFPALQPGSDQLRAFSEAMLLQQMPVRWFTVGGKMAVLALEPERVTALADQQGVKFSFLDPNEPIPLDVLGIVKVERHKTASEMPQDRSAGLAGGMTLKDCLEERLTGLDGALEAVPWHTKSTIASLVDRLLPEMATIGVQADHNKRMQDFLRSQGFPNAVPMYIDKGSMRGTWRIYSKIRGKGLEGYEKWTPDAAEKLNALGFSNYDGKPLGQYSGNGGYFQIFARFRPTAVSSQESKKLGASTHVAHLIDRLLEADVVPDLQKGKLTGVLGGAVSDLSATAIADKLAAKVKSGGISAREAQGMLSALWCSTNLEQRGVPPILTIRSKRPRQSCLWHWRRSNMSVQRLVDHLLLEGFSRYWENPDGFTDEQWATFTAKAKQIFQVAARKKIALAGGDGNGKPVIDDKVVMFNGANPDGYETCTIQRTGDKFGFCKTAQKPYDVVVKAVLDAAAQVNPDFTVTTG